MWELKSDIESFSKNKMKSARVMKAYEGELNVTDESRVENFITLVLVSSKNTLANLRFTTLYDVVK